MSTFVDPLEWKLVKISLAAVALVVVAVGVAWTVHDHLHPAPTRL
jgi:hypothetical protein